MNHKSCKNANANENANDASDTESEIEFELLNTNTDQVDLIENDEDGIIDEKQISNADGGGGGGGSGSGSGSGSGGSDKLQYNKDFYIQPLEEHQIEQAICNCFADQYDEFDAPITVRAHFLDQPSGFYCATIPIPDEDEQQQQQQQQQRLIVGVIGATIDQNDAAFIGLYGVHPAYRGKGIGSVLFDHCMRAIVVEPSNRSVGLYAVPSMRAKYAATHFHHIETGVSMVNFVGVPSEAVCDLMALIARKYADHCVTVCNDDENYAAIKEAIVRYDCTMRHNQSRAKVLEVIFANTGTKTTDQQQIQPGQYVCCAVLSRRNNSSKSNRIKGWGCLRMHTHSNRLMFGPIYAETLQSAVKIVAKLVTTQREALMQYGALYNAITAQPAGLRLAQAGLGLREFERCDRLFSGQQLPRRINYQPVYAVMSPDFCI